MKRSEMINKIWKEGKIDLYKAHITDIIDDVLREAERFGMSPPVWYIIRPSHDDPQRTWEAEDE